MNMPPLPDDLMNRMPIGDGAVLANMIVKYGALCRKMALGEAHAWMLQRHEAQKHRDNYMLVEANRFAKELLK